MQTLPEVFALEAEWRQVWACDPEATVFQSFDWVSNWLATYLGPSGKAFIVVCRHEGRCVGIAPFYLRPRSIRKFRRATLMFTGTGEAEREESFAEYMAPFSDPSYRQACNEIFAREIAHFRDVYFSRVRLDLLKPLVALIEHQSPLKFSSASLGYCYGMPAGLELALAALSSKQRNGVKGKIARLRALEGFEVEVAMSEASRQRLFLELVQLHNESWQSRGKPGVFANRRFRDFHDALSAELLRNQALLLLAIRTSQKTLAVVYGLCDRKACRYYQSGFDLKAQPTLSIGTLAHFLATDAVMQSHLAHYDLLLASEPTYKSRIARPTAELFNIRGR